MPSQVVLRRADAGDFERWFTTILEELRTHDLTLSRQPRIHRSYLREGESGVIPLGDSL